MSLLYRIELISELEAVYIESKLACISIIVIVSHSSVLMITDGVFYTRLYFDKFKLDTLTLMQNIFDV